MIKIFLVSLISVIVWANPQIDSPVVGESVIQNDGRIVNGRDAFEGQFPYQVSLRHSNEGHFCGGSIIGPNLIVTAAHCVDRTEFYNLEVVAGRHRKDFSSLNEQRRRIDQIVIHPEYDVQDEYSSQNDIALLHLDSLSPLIYNDFVQPINLPSVQQQPTYGEVVVSGWGALFYGDHVGADVLQWIKVFVVNDTECQRLYAAESLQIHPSMICAGQDNKDSCQGDSGGPMVKLNTQGSSTPFLSGIVSWGVECADPRFPGVYTETSYFLDWIEENREPSKDYDSDE